MEVAGLMVSIMSCLCAGNCVNETVCRQCEHLRRHRRKMGKLRRKLNELTALVEEVKTRLEEMQIQHGMEPKAGVRLWLQNVEKIESEVSESISQDEEKNLSYCHPSNLCSQVKFGKFIEESMEEVVELIEKGKVYDSDLFAEKLPKRGRILPTTLLLMNPTTRRILMKIWEYLMDSRVGRIGVYGMGGIGKTTIVTEINNRLLKEGSRFDCVLWVTVSKDTDLERLQADIAKQLNLDLSDCVAEIERCAELYEALCRRKRFVLILDDLWEPFTLEKVGIPIPTTDNGCKLVLTTRSSSICRGMETDRDVEVKVLSEDEAWNVFREKVGEAAILNSDIQNIAKEVTKECGGLPLAIITVGRALRGASDISDWANALTELRGSTASIEGMEELVFARLMFSFMRLRNDVTRSCFLFCSLYPEGHQIDINELIDYWIWEGMLGDAGRMQEKKRMGKLILKELKNACLLESVTQDGIEHVRVHDLIRDMAVLITRTSPLCIIKAGIGQKKPPWIDEWVENVHRVSLMRNDLKGIPFKPSCPKLTSLLLQYNSLSENICHSFFEDMKSLEILDLSYTGIEFLPKSLSDLENLRALLLSNCWNLSATPSMDRLDKLMVLDLSWSPRIVDLPRGIEKLCKLRRINITWTSIEVFPDGLLAALTQLEDLWMVGCGFLWGSKRVRTIKGGANIEEVISSTSLLSLKLDFWNSEVFNYYVRSEHWDQLDTFKFCIGQPFADFSEETRGISLRGSFLTKGRPISLPTNTFGLCLDDCEDITQLSECIPNLKELKSCEVYYCENMQSIVKSGGNNLSALERIKLDSLNRLRTMNEGFLEQHTLINLKIIEIVRCGSLKSLFLDGLSGHLQNLEEIIVIDCSNIRCIMQEKRREEDGSSNASIISLPRFQSLKLHHLPNLKSIYDGILSCDCLRSIQIWGCDALRRLPLMLSINNDQQRLLLPPPALKEILGTSKWWESLKWDQPDSKMALEPYFLDVDANMHIVSWQESGMRPTLQWSNFDTWKLNVVGDPSSSQPPPNLLSYQNEMTT